MSSNNPVRRQRRRGAAAVEFALTFPIVVLLAMGIVEYGWMFYEYNTVHSALRDAARFGAKNAGGDPVLGGTVARVRLLENLGHYGLCTAGCADSQQHASVPNAFILMATVPYEPITGFGVPGVPNELYADIVFAVQP